MRRKEIYFKRKWFKEKVEKPNLNLKEETWVIQHFLMTITIGTKEEKGSDEYE